MTPPVAVPLRLLQLNSLLTGGGTDDQVGKLALGLHQLGQCVWVAGPAGRLFSNVLLESGVPFHATPREGLAKLGFIFAVARFIRRQQLQIVHAHHGRDYWPTVLAARLSGVRPKIVLSRHLAKSPSSWFSQQFLLGQCDALIAVSHFTAQVLREGVNEMDSPEVERRTRPPMHGDFGKIHIIHSGIDGKRFRPFEADGLRREWGLASEHYAFAVVGGYDRPRGKGQREFLAAAARIHEKIPHARFLIIGRGNLAETLHADIARLGLTGKACLTAYCREMPAVMNAIDCLVHPQVGTEALGLVLCEATACGKPVIASALDGIPEAFAAGNYGQLVKPESIDELAEAMLVWANQPALALPARERLHQQVEQQFSWLITVRKVFELYLALMNHAKL